MNNFSPEYNEASDKPRVLEALPNGSSIVVVGAGAFGGWSALQLLRQGYKVTLLDHWGGGNSRASSGGETRLIRCIYGSNPFYTTLANRAYDLWIENEPLLGGQFLYPTGCLWFTDDDTERILQDALTVITKEGLEYEQLTPEVLKQRFPQIDPWGRSVVLEKKTGYLLARAATRAVQELFVREGGVYHAGAGLPGKITNGGLDEIKVNGNSLNADRYLFACGPWLKGLFPELFSKRLRITRQEIFYFGLSPEQERIFEQLPTWIDQREPNFYYGIPFGIGRGFKIANDLRGPEVDPTNQERIPSSVEIEKARAYMSRRFPGLEGLPLLEARVCQYSDTARGNFIFDHHPEAENLWVLGGGSGHGFKHGPALGELVTDIWMGKKALPHDLML